MLAARSRAAQDATALHSNVVGSDSFSSISSSSSSSWQRLSPLTREGGGPAQPALHHQDDAGLRDLPAEADSAHPREGQRRAPRAPSSRGPPPAGGTLPSHRSRCHWPMSWAAQACASLSPGRPRRPVAPAVQGRRRPSLAGAAALAAPCPRQGQHHSPMRGAAWRAPCSILQRTPARRRCVPLPVAANTTRP